MKTFIGLAVLTLMSANAFAGTTYVCNTSEVYGIRVRANDSILVLSNMRVSAGRKTIATFKDSEGTLNVSGGNSPAKTFVGTVDLRRVGTNRGGELLFGTRLDQVRQIEVRVSNWDGLLTGLLEVTKRDGYRITKTLGCHRQ